MLVRRMPGVYIDEGISLIVLASAQSIQGKMRLANLMGIVLADGRRWSQTGR